MLDQLKKIPMENFTKECEIHKKAKIIAYEILDLLGYLSFYPTVSDHLEKIDDTRLSKTLNTIRQTI